MSAKVGEKPVLKFGSLGVYYHLILILDILIIIILSFPSSVVMRKVKVGTEIQTSDEEKDEDRKIAKRKC